MTRSSRTDHWNRSILQWYKK